MKISRTLTLTKLLPTGVGRIEGDVREKFWGMEAIIDRLDQGNEYFRALEPQSFGNKSPRRFEPGEHTLIFLDHLAHMVSCAVHAAYGLALGA